MSSYLSMVEARLPPGFRFHPRDDELVCDYLAPSKLDASMRTPFPMMIDVDLNTCEPWDLPDMACVGSKEWYFFNLRDRKYATGQRTNRATTSGYWKATGKDRHVVRKGTPVGMRKTLVFYRGRAPRGTKTDWVMHEFRSEGRGDPPPRLISSKDQDWVLCRVFCKSRSRTGVYPSEPKTKESSCCEDTGSSSLPPLADAAHSDVGLNHRQSTDNFPPLRPPPSTVGATSLVEQVPCFSNCHHQIVVPTVGTNCKSYSMDHLASTCLKSVLDQLSKDSRRDGVVSSESYLSTDINGDISSSMWFPNFES